MKNLTLLFLGKLSLIFGFLGWLAAVVTASFRFHLPYLPWGAHLSIVFVTCVLSILAVPLFQWHKGKRREALEPFRASRTVALAQAALVLSAVSVGWHSGILLFLVPSWVLQPVVLPFLWILMAIVAYGGLGIIAWLIQQWGTVREDHDSADVA